MTDTETEVIQTKPAPKKKAAKRKPAAKKAAPPKPVAEPGGPFVGLTVTDCCDGCNVAGCVISGRPYCAHPRKGGLQSAEIQDSAALKRQNQAKRILGDQMLQARSV